MVGIGRGITDLHPLRYVWPLLTKICSLEGKKKAAGMLCFAQLAGCTFKMATSVQSSKTSSRLPSKGPRSVEPLCTSTHPKRSVLIVTAGLSRSGKSTALNNIFGTDFKSGYSASSVTKTVEVRCVDGHEDELIVVDTPGLAARDIKTSKIRTELRNAIGGLNFVLVYCHSVAPNSSICKADEYVVNRLQKFLGKDIWKKCVLLFTFSDTLRHDECPRKADRNKYQQHLDDHAEQFSKLIQEQCGAHAPRVRIISEETVTANQDILAVPVGKKLSVGKEEHMLVPGVKINWRKLAARMIIEKAPDVERNIYKSLFQDKISISTPLAGFLVGAAVGAVGGATVGLAMGGIVAIPGAVVGAAVGAGTGLVLGGVSGGAMAGMGRLLNDKIKAKRSMKKFHNLRASKHVEDHAPPVILDTESDCVRSNAHEKLVQSTRCHSYSAPLGSRKMRSLPCKGPLQEVASQDEEALIIDTSEDSTQGHSSCLSPSHQWPSVSAQRAAEKPDNFDSETPGLTDSPSVQM